MSKIKICGLSRLCDIDYVNEAKPDYAGFVIDFPKSRRNVTVKQLTELRQRLDERITSVGVFVNEEVEIAADLLNRNLISVAQLHGSEDETYIKKLRSLSGQSKITKAFTVRRKEDILTALQSSADYILLDNGTGTGASFDWTLLGSIDRPWFLAGGLHPGNIRDAIAAFHPYAVDLSSGVETDGKKDRQKILDAVQCCRGNVIGQTQTNITKKEKREVTL